VSNICLQLNVWLSLPMNIRADKTQNMTISVFQK